MGPYGLEFARVDEPPPPPPKKPRAVTLAQAQAWAKAGILAAGPESRTQDEWIALSCDALVRHWPTP